MPRSTIAGAVRAWLAGGLVAFAAVGATAENAVYRDVGQAIYRDGVAGSGAPLQASRDNHVQLHGTAVACVNCHRRSGLGAIEGRSKTPPIAAGYLFRASAGKASATDLPYVDALRADREPYSELTLARAIREGVDAGGKPLSYLMPRFDLNDADMTALIAYLKRLDPRRAPGVSATELHLATIITPDADPEKRKGMLAVLERFVAERNLRQRAPSAQLVTSAKTMYSQMMFRPARRWQLHVWQLSGPASTWQAQLERYLAAQPVFAVLSGLGGADWSPVHGFCEKAALPCLFPNVAATPPEVDRSFYSLYFSRGVELEAELIARSLIDSAGAPLARKVLQVYRAGDVGQAGAAALTRALQAHGIVVHARELPANAQLGVSDPLSPPGEAGAGDAQVLWLRPSDLALLSDPPGETTALYVSGLMGGLERAPLPAAWRERVRMAYPFDLPERRRVRVDFALGWFRAERIPLVALQEQVDTYLACSLLSETLNHMIDTMVRDYLIERVEDTIEHRIITGYYPRLTLGPGQRYASKGGYIVRLRANPNAGVIAASDWTIP